MHWRSPSLTKPVSTRLKQQHEDSLDEIIIYILDIMIQMIFRHDRTTSLYLPQDFEDQLEWSWQLTDWQSQHQAVNHVKTLTKIVLP